LPGVKKSIYSPEQAELLRLLREKRKEAGLSQIELVPFPVGEFRDGGWILVKEEEGVLTFLSALT